MLASLSAALQPYKDIVGTTASYLTILQFFSGFPICYEIKKKGTTRDVSAVPFVGGVAVGIAMLQYALLLQDQVMLTVNVAAISLNVIYCAIYFFYSEDKLTEFLKPSGWAAALIAVLVGYCQVENAEQLEFRYGLIVTILMLLLLGNPLIGIKEIVEKKDASQIPFVLTFMGTIVTFTWLVYAVILLNNFMIVQNVIGFILCAIQLVLLFLYPGKPKKSKPKKKSQ